MTTVSFTVALLLFSLGKFQRVLNETNLFVRGIQGILCLDDNLEGPTLRRMPILSIVSSKGVADDEPQASFT